MTHTEPVAGAEFPAANAVRTARAVETATVDNARAPAPWLPGEK